MYSLDSLKYIPGNQEFGPRIQLFLEMKMVILNVF